MGTSDLLDRAFKGTIEFLRPVPSVALVPLAILVLGTALSSQVLLASFAALWPVLLQTVYGVRHLDEVSLDTARSYGLPSRVVLCRIRVPRALPFIMTGIRISSAMSLILVVTAGLVIGSPGLGHGIDLVQQSWGLSGHVRPHPYDGAARLQAQRCCRRRRTGVLHWKYNGALVSAPPPGMAMVFQEYSQSLYPWMSVGANVELPLRHQRRITSRERASACVTPLSRSGFRTWKTGCPGNCRAVCSSGWRPPGRWPTSPRSSSWTSPSRRSMRRPAVNWKTWCWPYGHSSGSRSCSYP